MKKYFLILLTACIFFSCNDDERVIFDADTSDLVVSFEPFEGGAIMNYTLPANTEIYGIMAKYIDSNGKEITVKGTHANNTIELFGFNEAQEEVAIEVYLVDSENNYTKPVVKSFSTLASAALTVFDNLEVNSHWNGFRVNYPEFSGRTGGKMHIYFVGLNPLTNIVEPIIVSTLPINSDGGQVEYNSISDTLVDDVTVIVKTEDSRGNVVKEEVFENIEVARAEQFNSSEIGFEGSSVEDETTRVGSKYLFDGDVKGEQCLLKGDPSKLYSYRSEKNAEFNNNVITLDLQNQEEIAWIRIYSHLSAKLPNVWNNGGTKITMKLEFQWYYPSNITLYGTNDKDAPEDQWDELSSFYEYAQLERDSRWSAPAFDPENFYTIDEIDQFRAAPANYIQLNCDISGTAYRYLKVKINQTYYFQAPTYDAGMDGIFGMEELEVFVKSE